MRTNDSPWLSAWRRAEDAYVEACQPFLESEAGGPALGKDHLIALVCLRHRADVARERYYLAGLGVDDND